MSEKAPVRGKQLFPRFVGLIRWPFPECSVVTEGRLRCFDYCFSANVVFMAPRELTLDVMPILILRGVFSGEKAEPRET